MKLYLQQSMMKNVNEFLIFDIMCRIFCTEESNCVERFSKIKNRMSLLRIMILILLGILCTVHICEAGFENDFQYRIFMTRGCIRREAGEFYCRTDHGPFENIVEAFLECIRPGKSGYFCRWNDGGVFQDVTEAVEKCVRTLGKEHYCRNYDGPFESQTEAYQKCIRSENGRYHCTRIDKGPIKNLNVAFNSCVDTLKDKFYCLKTNAGPYEDIDQAFNECVEVGDGSMMKCKMNHTSSNNFPE